MRKQVLILLACCCLFCFNSSVFAELISDYLATDDIGGYRASKNPSVGEGPGSLAGTDHFYRDHSDITYRISYFNPTTSTGAKVQVTQHEGSDSDRWLLHELEDAYRGKESIDLGLLAQGTRLRDFNGRKFFGLRGSGYSWISNNVFIDISSADLYGNKPEPMEIIAAYMEKFPSTLPLSLELNREHDELWIKSEMDRRLWLCDKWLQQLAEGQLQLYETLRAIVDDHLDMFLRLRERYYEIDSSNEKRVLAGFLTTQNGEGIRTKLEEYMQWWAQNRNKPISLP